MSYPPQLPPPPNNSGTLKSINWGVWILVFVFVGIPLLIALCCCGVPMLGATFEGMTGGINP